MHLPVLGGKMPSVFRQEENYAHGHGYSANSRMDPVPAETATTSEGEG